jgi:glutamate 5-kinase
MNTSLTAPRHVLKNAKRIVVKFGSRVLLDASGKPDLERMRNLVRQVALLRLMGRQVVVVTSGAVGAGMEVLGLKKRPKNLPDLQMAASVGQPRLMATYTQFFAEYDCQVGQVLLTHEDLKHRVRHLNTRNTMCRLLESNVIPIVNENDVVAVDEFKVGDNDVLASMVAMLVGADTLILNTTVDGLQETAPDGSMRRVKYVPSVTSKVLGLAKGKGSDLSTGGMATKLMAAHSMAKIGGVALIIDGRKPDEITRAMGGEDCGTFVGTEISSASLSSRKQWIAFFHRVQGTIVVDDGAKQALLERGKSLLAAGIVAVQGNFGVGASVKVESKNGDVIARGLVEYASSDIEKIKGQTSSQIEAILGAISSEEVIHRDNIYVER